MVIIGFFFEIFECVQRLRTFLDLIKDDQRLFRENLLTGDHGQKLYDTLRILVCLKYGFQLIFFIKVEVDIIVIVFFSKFLHKPGLPNLPGSLQHHWLTFIIQFPGNQVLYCISFHTDPPPSAYLVFYYKITHFSENMNMIFARFSEFLST